MRDTDPDKLPENSIAIVAMAGRFPGASSVTEFWQNQLAGKESISRFSIDELEIANKEFARDNDTYVRARSVLNEIDQFDAEFFGIYPLEAKVMDPQQRLFMESCWEAFEAGGYDPAAYPGPVGVFAGCSIPTYFLTNLCRQPGFIEKFTGDYQAGSFPELLGNGVDFFATRVAYKLDLKGPAITVATACSTSLVAVVQACQSLLTFQCDMALAGGASISLPQKRGTNYIEGGMTSPDGHCRTFDADAGGTVFGSGVGVVLLKRLEDALEDGDPIHAVIRGFGINNDGAGKIGYTAPSIDGQADAITMALDIADIDPRSIGYVEAHGTGTPLGDPIEMAALKKAFASDSADEPVCVIGTAKTNVGHLDAAAGVTGLINATHIVRDAKFPATLHFKAPNPKLGLEGSRFTVNRALSDWPESGVRRAGVSAFGVGGTNAHVIIEAPPAREVQSAKQDAFLLPLSARTPTALAAMQQNLAAHLEANPELPIADVAWTLQTGRRRFDHGSIVVAATTQEALEALKGEAAERTQERATPVIDPKICFMFPGQGAQHVGMGRGLYASQPVYRQAFDECAELLLPLIELDLRSYVYPEDEDDGTLADRLRDTAVAQPAIFSVEYALAKLWQSLGIKPEVLIGHSIGEFAAACLAGVFSLPDALKIVAARGRLMQDVAPGSMLAVSLPEADLRPRLTEHLSIAAINAPKACVIAGPSENVETFASDLKSEGISCRPLVTSHAFHSAMMDPVVAPFREIVARIDLQPPAIPIISTVTGALMRPEEATDPDYWARHLRQPVKFSDAIAQCRADEHAVLLEAGPGNTLNTLARLHPAKDRQQVAAASLPGPGAGERDQDTILHALGALWLAGITPDWSALSGSEPQQRVRQALPTYPFERKRVWLDVEATEARSAPSPTQSVTTSPQAMMDPSVMQDAQSPNAQSDTPTQDQPAQNRQARIRAALVDIFEDLSGKALSGEASEATFLELGFDSLFLTQATRAVQKDIGLKITFRQLLGDLATFDDLAAYADKKLAPDAFAAPEPTLAPEGSTRDAQSPPAPPTAAARPMPDAIATAASDTDLTALMREQLQVMNQVFSTQIAALQGQPGAATAPTALLASTEQTVSTPLQHPPVENLQVPVETPPEAAQPDAGAPKVHGPFAPLEAKRSTDITSRQAAKIDNIVRAYNAHAPESKRRTEAHRARLADPRVVSGFRAEWKDAIYPIITQSSKGSRLKDVDGNEYIDLLNGFGPIMFGHRPDFVEEAMRAQLGEGIEIGPQTPLAGEIAELFCDMTGNERMTFCNTGSEAVMAAMRLARTVTGREKIVMFSGDYHGMFDEVLVKPWTSRQGEPGAIPLAPGIPRESVANIIVLDYGTDDSLRWITENVEDLAAVIVEPVQSRRPDFQPVDFLRSLREVTKAAGTALVFDEVVTGFRSHPGGCQELFSIRADMATYGKVLGGGMPVGVLAGRAEFMDALDGGQWRFGDDSCPEVGMTFFAGTFVRHPLTLAAVKAVLQHIKAHGPSLSEELAQRTTQMVARINAVFERLNVPTRMANYTSFMFFKFPAEERFASLFYVLLRRHGVHVQEGFPCFLTTAHSDEDIDKIVAAFETAALEMHEGALFTTSPEDVAAPVSAVAPTADERRVPLTEPQREIFHAAILGDDVSCAFNESFSIDLHGPLNDNALASAIDTLMARHGALRAKIDTDGASMQIDPAAKLVPTREDFSNLPPAAAQEAFSVHLADNATSPFDLFAGPLIRATIVKMAEAHHVLVVTAHHIICDGWSCDIIATDLAELYSAAVEQRAPSLEAPADYAAFARQDVAMRSSSENTEAESYWLEQYETIPILPELPTDRPRGPSRTYAGATETVHVSQAAYQSIKEAGAKHGMSLFATLLASYAALLYRLSGQSDLAIGIPLAGQSSLDNTNLVGHCVNALPLRISVDGTSTAEALMSEAREKLLDAYEHQTFTYGTLVQRLNLIRDPNRLPLSEVQFNVEQFAPELKFSGLTATATANPKGAVNADVFLNVGETPSGLKLDCDYNCDLYDGATIASWLQAFADIAAQLVEDPKILVSDLRLPGELSTTGPTSLRDDEQRLIASWNETQADYPRDQSIIDVFEQQVAARPEATALEFSGETMSYQMLNTFADQLADRIAALGVSRGDRVAVCIPRSFDLMATILAVLKVGAAYVPIDPQSPPERIAFVLRDANAKAIVTDSTLDMPDVDARVLMVDAVAGVQIASPTEAVFDRPAADDLAYVMYTSGSTGRPKGVMVEHRSAVQLVCNSDIQDFGQGQRALLSVSVAFDPSLLDILGSLLNGGTLVIMPPEVAEPAAIARHVEKHKITALVTTTGVFHVLVEDHLDQLGSLRQMNVGGEVLSPSHAQKFIDSLPHATLIAAYGPTEATTIATFSHFRHGDRIPDPVPIGRPMANTRTYIVDDQLKQLAIGERGELVIAGDGLARGYLDHAELTREKFVTMEIAPGLTERVYRTGDLASFDDTGILYFHGRLDGQVKLRGYRIEIGEIESELARQENVAGACVVAVKEAGRVSRLAAFVTPVEGAKLSPDALKRAIAATLMPYMVPGSIEVLDSLPLNVNGKIDRDALTGLAEQHRLEREYVAPETDGEIALAEITREVMKLDTLGVTENLFELGLDSLMMFQIASRAEKAGITVTPRAIMEARSIRAALQVAAAAPPTLAPVTSRKITRAVRQKVTLSPAARRQGI